MVRDRLAQDDAKAGFLLDGFPRNIAQAYELDSMLGDLGTTLDVVLDSRSTTRKWCAACPGGVCARSAATCGTSSSTRRRSRTSADKCGGELYHRDDDYPETVRPPPGRLRVADQAADRVLRPAQAVGRHGRARPRRGRHRARDRVACRICRLGLIRCGHLRDHIELKVARRDRPDARGRPCRRACARGDA